MSMIMSIVSEADALALAVELAKNKVELAKANLESAKQELERVKDAYEEVLKRSEEAGIAKSKLKKLVEDRIQEMASLGFVNAVDATGAAVTEKPKRTRKTDKSGSKKAEVVSASPMELVTNEETTSLPEEIVGPHEDVGFESAPAPAPQS